MHHINFCCCDLRDKCNLVTFILFILRASTISVYPDGAHLSYYLLARMFYGTKVEFKIVRATEFIVISASSLFLPFKYSICFFLLFGHVAVCVSSFRKNSKIPFHHKYKKYGYFALVFSEKHSC